MVRVIPTAIVRSETAATTGGLLLASTVTLKLWVAFSGGSPLSVPITLKALDPISAWVGAQVNTPLVASITAFVAAPAPKLKVSICGGLSGSVAALVMGRVIPTAIVRSETAATTGGLLLASTVTLKLWVALSGGSPLSVTTM